MKKILIYLFLIILVAGSIYFYKDEKDKSKETNDKTTNVKEDKTHEEIKCIADYECIMKDNKKYYFSNRTSIDVNNMYNYVTDEMEAGTLKIENGTLEFVGMILTMILANRRLRTLLIPTKEKMMSLDF